MPGQLADIPRIRPLRYKAMARRNQLQAVGSGKWLITGVTKAADPREGNAVAVKRRRMAALVRRIMCRFQYE